MVQGRNWGSVSILGRQELAVGLSSYYFCTTIPVESHMSLFGAECPKSFTSKTLFFPFNILIGILTAHVLDAVQRIALFRDLEDM